MRASMGALMRALEPRESRPCETMAPEVLKGRKVELGLGTREVG
jgi:hypothetical protein